MILRTCYTFTGAASLGDSSRGREHPGQRVALRIHRGVRVGPGKSELLHNIGKAQI
jgi:hypothetical protein